MWIMTDQNGHISVLRADTSGISRKKLRSSASHASGGCRVEYEAIEI